MLRLTDDGRGMPMKLLQFLLMVLLTLPYAVAAESKSSVGHAEQAFHMWLAAHNAGERQLFEAFKAKYKDKDDVQWFVDFRESQGTFQLVEVKSSTPTSVEALVVSEWGNALLARITLKPGDSLELSSMGFEGVPTPDAFKPEPMELDALVAETRERLNALESKGKLSGSFLLMHNGESVFAWTGGLADREANVPVSAETQFRMASLGKMFTAVAILQLAEDGRLSLDDPLSRHLTDYPNQEVAAAVTLRQLLNHTSGTGDIFGKEFPKISGSLRTHRDYWGRFAAAPLKFEAGAKDGYSNYGYILLGSVIEAISGQSYYDYVDQHIYRPAGMTSTGSKPESESIPGRAHAYTKVDGKWTRETATLPWRGMAAGGGYTTTRDLVRFATALTNGTLISAESLEAATRPQNNKGSYGYGFGVSGEGPEREFGHSGGALGANAVFSVLPVKGYTVVGLSNFDPSTMGDMVRFVTRRLP